MRKALETAGRLIYCLAVFLMILLSSSIFWMLDTWKNLTIDEMIFHLRAPKEGVDGAIIMGFVTRCIVPAVLTVMLIVIVLKFFKKNQGFFLGLILSFAVLGTGLSVFHVWKVLDIGNYLVSLNTYSEFIDENYVYPSEVDISFPEKKRNLIYIYLESMENTFADQSVGGAFKENLIPNLTRISLENESFNGEGEVLNGGAVLNKTTFTMGALYGQSTGLPLMLPFNATVMSSQDSFMPQLDGIGDILQEEGYKNMFLIGSQAVFGGRNLFYRDHGDYEILDYDYALENGLIPEGYYVFWGYEDARLYENAKQKLLEESASGQPFNLTMLTVDTHFEDGYECNLCERLHKDNVYADVYNCADKQVSEFIQWTKEQEFYENTTIIIAGDHLSMDSDFCKDTDSDYHRKTYFTIINGQCEVENDVCREYSTLDIFPTTLAALGVSIEGDRLGLGTNLYSSKPTLLEIHGEEKMNAEFDKKSAMMEYLVSENIEFSMDMYRDEWYYDALKYVVDRGLFSEEISTTGPDQNVTRAVVIQELYELDGQLEVKDKGRQLFSDIKGRDYEEAVLWGCNAGIIKDYDGDGKFQGDGYITREEIVSMFYGYAEYKNCNILEGEGLQKFADGGQTSEWALESMKWGVSTGIISGIENQGLVPKGNVTLGQAATFFMRLCENNNL